MISVYPSKLDGGPLEEHATHRRMTLDQWFADNVPNYSVRESPPISVHINGEYISHAQWGVSEFSPGDSVDVYVEAKGWEIIASTGALIAGAMFALKAIMPRAQIPKGNDNQGQGKRLAESTIKGNQPALNSPIPEIFGTRKVYPGYLLPPHRYFSGPREQTVSMTLCIGKGDYDAPFSGVEIGNTPVISLGAAAILNIYGPGADLSTDTASQWWHTSEEVGASSKGTAGLELTTTAAVDAVASASAFSFSGVTVTIPSGAGTFPTGWASGMIARITVNYPYTVTTGGVGGRNIITGNMDQLFLVPGALIEITGDNAGLYIVNTITAGTSGTMTLNYSNGDPATALSTGARQMCIGYRGLKYRLTAASSSVITVERLTDTGSTDTGWPGFAVLTTSAASVILDQSSLEGNWLGPFCACPENQLTSTIEWDYFFAGGLGGLSGDGSWLDIGAYTEMQYRDFAVGGAWTSVQHAYGNRTFDQLGYTNTVNTPYPMRPEVRVRRLGAKSPDPSVQNGIQWYGLRSRIDAPSSYAGVTTLTLKVIGGDKISTQVESLVSARVTRKLPEITGGAAVANRNIAPCIKYIAESVGYTEADIDMAELIRLDAVWRARGDYFDDAFDGSGTVKSAISGALQAGFSELTVDRGLIRPVRDEPRTTFEQMYTPQNMTGPLSREFATLTPDDFDGVDVEYTDAITWQVETVECRLPGDLGTRVEKVRVLGVTSRTRAWRIGMRARRIQKYRRKAFKFSTEMDAFNSRYLSYCALADDVPGYAQSSILEAYAPSGGGFILVSSEAFDWSAGGVHVVSIRRKDGTLSGPYTATRIDDYRLSIPTLDFVPDTSWAVEPPHLLFGTLARSNYPVLITDISPSGQYGASVSAVGYDVRVYADDDNSPP
jgi:hypothetical protein